jgi:hypothetical protein
VLARPLGSIEGAGSGRGRLERAATGDWSGGGVEDRQAVVAARAGTSVGQHRRSGRRTGGEGGGYTGGGRGSFMRSSFFLIKGHVLLVDGLVAC